MDEHSGALLNRWPRMTLRSQRSTSHNKRMAKFLNTAVNFTQVFASIKQVILVTIVSCLSRYRLVLVGKNFAMRKPLVETSVAEEVIMSADKVDVYDSKKWVRDMMGKPKSWLVDYLRNTLRSSAPSASTNNASLPCGESFGSVLCARHIKCDCSACPERHSARQA